MIDLEKSTDSVDHFSFIKTEQLTLPDPEKRELKTMFDSVDVVNVVQELPQSDPEKPELKSADAVVQEHPQSYLEPAVDLYGPDVNAPVEAEDDLVTVELQRSLSNSPNSAEDNGVVCGLSSEHFTDEMEMDKEDLTTVIFYPDHMMYRDSYCTDCVLTFTSSCLTIEGSTIDDDDKTLRLQWGVQDIRHIKSHWYGSVGMAMVTILVLDGDTVHGENVECTSGTELKFAVTGADWYGKREAVTFLNVAYKFLWSNMLESEELDNGHTLASFTKYFPNFDQPFEEVIYPKGDVDAVSISKREVDMLLPDTFVNDTIIDFYIKYLKNKIKPEDKNRFHFFNSFFFRKLADPEKRPLDASEGKAAFQRVRKWTRKVNIFEKDYVFIPVNYNYHWSLIVMCHLGEVALNEDEDVTKLNKVPCVLHMDSIKGSHTGLKALMQSYLKEEWKGRIQDESEDISSRFDNLRFISLELPQQPNSYDCGLFLLHYVELFLEQAPICFNPFHITDSVNFLNVDWFTPADASLKRVVIQRLVYDLLEQPSHKVQRSITANDDNNINEESAVNFFPVMCNNSSTLCQNSQDDHGIEGIEMSLLPSLSMRNEPCPVGPTASSKSVFEPGSFLGMQFPSFNETMFDGYKCSLELPVEEDVKTSGQFIYSPTEINLQKDDEIEIIPEITYSSQDFKTSRQSWHPNNNFETSPETSISGCEDSLELINTCNQINEELDFKEIEDQQPRIDEEIDFKDIEDQQPRINEEEFNCKDIENHQPSINEELDFMELEDQQSRINEEFDFKEIEDQQPRINEEFDFKEIEDQQPRINEEEFSCKDIENHQPRINEESDFKEIEDQQPRINEEFASKEIEDHQPRINEEFNCKDIENQQPIISEDSDIKEIEDQLPSLPYTEPIDMLDGNNLISDMQMNEQIGSDEDESSGFESDVLNPTKRMRMTEPTLEGDPACN